MSQMWTRFANLYLKWNERIEVRIWIGNGPACDIFVKKLDSAIEDIVGPRWDASDFSMYRPKFGVTIQCSEEVGPTDVQDVVQAFKDACFDVSEKSELEEMEFGWGVQTFDGLLEVRVVER